MACRCRWFRHCNNLVIVNSLTDERPYLVLTKLGAYFLVHHSSYFTFSELYNSVSPLALSPTIITLTPAHPCFLQ
jgi:hypothetical protein